MGRSTVTPTVSSGAVTMNTISSTSITSTNGVTLIAAIGARRWRRESRCGASSGLVIGMASGRLLLLLLLSIPGERPLSSSRDSTTVNSSAKLVTRLA